MGVQVSNNAYSTLASTLSSVATSLSVQSGQGARFPAASVASGNFFYVTLINTANDLEIVKVTDRSTDTFTITRAQDGTTARAYAVNDRVELRPVAAVFNALPNRLLVTADYTDASVTSAKLAVSGVTAGSYGGLGKDLSVTVNSKGQVTSISETSGLIQTNTFSFTSAGATQTWTKPDAGSLIRVQLWGAGGGGGRGATNDGRGGGGGGGYVEAWYKFADLGSTASIVVGNRGSGATTAGVGTAGTASTFSSSSISLTAYAGAGGGITSDGSDGQSGGGGAGAAASGSGTSSGRLGGGVGATYNNSTLVYTAAGDASTIWGGGGGGAGSYGNASATYSPGGYAVYGGGGGGGGYNGTGTSSGGTSIFGGSGGSGSTASAVGGDGATPGGGGGGAETANGGNGGYGLCVVTVY